jgi:hypothetical protein
MVYASARNRMHFDTVASLPNAHAAAQGRAPRTGKTYPAEVAACQPRDCGLLLQPNHARAATAMLFIGR